MGSRLRTALIGVPWDRSSSFMRGAAGAPARIREALWSDSSNPWSERGVDVSVPGLLDPAFAPGVSHPEPGGLSTRDVVSLIHRLPARIVGADLVEYNPDNDVRDLTARVAAKLVKELVGSGIVG